MNRRNFLRLTGLLGLAVVIPQQILQPNLTPFNDKWVWLYTADKYLNVVAYHIYAKSGNKNGELFEKQNPHINLVSGDSLQLTYTIHNPEEELYNYTAYIIDGDGNEIEIPPISQTNKNWSVKDWSR